MTALQKHQALIRGCTGRNQSNNSMDSPVSGHLEYRAAASGPCAPAQPQGRCLVAHLIWLRWQLQKGSQLLGGEAQRSERCRGCPECRRRVVGVATLSHSTARPRKCLHCTCSIQQAQIALLHLQHTASPDCTQPAPADGITTMHSESGLCCGVFSSTTTERRDDVTHIAWVHGASDRRCCVPGWARTGSGRCVGMQVASPTQSRK